MMACMSDSAAPTVTGLLPPDQLPTVTGDGHGDIIAMGGMYVRNAVQTVFEALGGARGLEAWARSSNARLDSFYEKIAPKLIVKHVQVDDRRSVDDMILELDGSPAQLPTRHVEEPVDAEFEDAEVYD